MNYATISADVISYTALKETEKRKVETYIKQLINDLSERYKKQKFYGRLVQGDYIECAMDNPQYALRIALLLKTYIKSIDLEVPKNEKSRIKYFSEHGIRLAVAVAPLDKLDPEEGIIDGEAIYLSGRAIKSYSTSDKQKIVIKNTMFFFSANNNYQQQFDVLFSLLDTILSKCSSKQSEVVYYKLLDLNEKEIAEKLGKYQSTISQHSTSAGWLSIEKAVNYFENIFK
ncbi:MAG: RNA polymerase subunit sigma-70 [Bacteroidales bacterium]